MRRLTARRRARGENGVAAVEFALILPIFLMLLFGIIDFGYMINRASVINNAARDAVRVATFEGATETQVLNTARQSLDGMRGANPTLGCRPGPRNREPVCVFNSRKTDDEVFVRVSYTHEFISPISIFFPGGIRLDRTSEMRVE
ncbi:TadE family protein [Nocardioides yefusunii]|uniref:TadE family protein n=1 Tax=Nocardioides yefusunii TaxID=2500546 RepID=A0ABW1QXG9_9ACTN|nr:TadE family protein [Nocardioides yefusunii]